MKNNLSLAVGAIVLIIFIALSAFAISKVFQRQAEEEIEPPPQPSPIGGFPAASPSPQTGQANIPTVQPESGSNTASENNIRIFIETPSYFNLVSSPLKVSGFTNLPSGVIVARVKDESGQILGQSLANTCTISDSCSFEMEILFTDPPTTTGTVEVYNPSSPNSSEEFLQKVGVRFD